MTLYEQYSEFRSDEANTESNLTGFVQVWSVRIPWFFQDQHYYFMSNCPMLHGKYILKNKIYQIQLQTFA